MNVRQVKEVAAEYVAANLASFPGLRAAHFVGSITTMPDEAIFPEYNDVDFHLILEEGSPLLESRGPFADILETAHRGVILEGGYKPVSDYQSAEIVLTNPEIAHHLTVDSALYDPDGWLQRFQEPVQRAYARRKWVLARVDYERRGLEWWQALRADAERMDHSGSMALNLLGYHFTFLTALLCVATLRSPTTGLHHLREILAVYGRLDLYEEAIAILGLRRIPADRIDRLLQEGAQAFDLAVQLRRSAHPFQHKLHAHQRPYFVDKCRSLIDAGHTDQAVSWMLAYYFSTIDVILIDGPDEVKPLYAGRRERLLQMLGMETPAARNERLDRLQPLDDQFFQLAADIVAANPKVFD